MADVVVYDFSGSMHVRTARLALAEKGGAELSLADLFLAPTVFYLGLTPEGEQMLPGLPHIGRWFDAIQQRPSFAATALSDG